MPTESIREGFLTPKKRQGREIGDGKMGWFVNLILWIVFAVAVIVVIAIVLFGPSAVFQVGVGALESATNSSVSQNTTQEYTLVAENFSDVQTAISGVVANVTGENLSQAQAGISGAVANVTGGNFSQVEARISGAVANVTRGK